MRSIRNRWIRGLGAVVLVSGFMITVGGLGVTSAAQSSNNLDNPTYRWDQALPAAQRFVVLAAFGNAAVLDKNTELVWEKAPLVTAPPPGGIFQDATYHCADGDIGGQKGWRLPSVIELASLIDPTVAVSPHLPTGHPFIGVQSAAYWSATEHSVTPSTAWLVGFGPCCGTYAPPSGHLGSDNKGSGPHFAWCVRGGMNEARY